MKPSDEIRAICERFKRDLGVKQKDLAALLRISDRTLIRYKNGETAPRVGDLERARRLLAEALRNKKRGA